MPRSTFDIGDNMDNVSVISGRSGRNLDSPARPGSLRRSLVNGGEPNLNTVIAKLNIITSQLTVNESRFEAQRIQIDEQQIQLDALQRQSEDVVELLESLMQEMSGLREDLKATALVIQPPESETAIPSTTINQRPTLKRPRGRPRVFCTICKSTDPLVDGFMCNTCKTTGRTAKQRKRVKRTVVEDRSKELDSPTSENSTASPQSAIEVMVMDHDEDNRKSDLPKVRSRPAAPEKHASIVSPTRALHDKAKAAQMRKESDAVPPTSVLSPIEPPYSKELDTLTDKKPTGTGEPSRIVTGSLVSGPFTEASSQPTVMNADITPPGPVERAMEARNRSPSPELSIAESLPHSSVYSYDTEEEGEDVVRRKTENDSLEEGEILSQSRQQAKGKQTIVHASIEPPKIQRTAKPTGRLPAQQGAVTISEVRNANGATHGPIAARPRKPRPTNIPDGDDSHHKLINKVMGPSWLGVKRK